MGKNNAYALISIIIPVYNGEKYIISLLDNILVYQKLHDIPLEVIVVDDKSTDQTLKLINSYHHPSLKVIESKTNQGSSVARNLGLEKCMGEYIFFIDSDDSISQDFFNHFQKVFTDNIDCYLFDMKWQHQDHCIQYHFQKVYDKRDIGRLGSVCNKIFRKNMLPKFNPQFRYYEDTVFLYDYLHENKNISLLKADNIEYIYNRNIEKSKSEYFDTKAYLHAQQYIFNIAKSSDRLTKMLCLETYLGVMFTTNYPAIIKIQVFLSAIYNFYTVLIPVLKKPIKNNVVVTIVSKV